jgi:hypothetical protein
LNKTLESLEESPLSMKKLSQVKYPEEKFIKVKRSCEKKKYSMQQTPVVATVQVRVK